MRTKPLGTAIDQPTYNLLLLLYKLKVLGALFDARPIEFTFIGTGLEWTADAEL